MSPEDVQQLAHEILRHRILLTYQAEAERVGSPRLPRLRERLEAFEAGRAWAASRPEEVLEGL